MGVQVTCGQFASDVQFVLRQTGPILSGRPSSDNCPPLERCPVHASLPPKPWAVPGREPHKALTFNLGCPNLIPSPSIPEPTALVGPIPDCFANLQGLELRIQRNTEELGHEAFWELQRDQARKHERQARLQALSAATAEHAAWLEALDAQACALEAELQLAAEAPGPPSATVSAAESPCQDLAIQEHHSLEMQGTLALVSQVLEAAEHAFQVQAQELEKLNRKLCQSNLQQFIQQTGAALPPPPQLDRTIPSTEALLPPTREELLQGVPQSHILVSSLSPEVPPTRQSSWK